MKIKEMIKTLQSKRTHHPKLDRLLTAVNDSLEQLDPKAVIQLVLKAGFLFWHFAYKTSLTFTEKDPSTYVPTDIFAMNLLISLSAKVPKQTAWLRSWNWKKRKT